MVAGEHCEQPLAPSLQEVIGDMSGQGRWATLLAAGSRTGAEFRISWTSMAEEARNIWEYLGEEATGALADPLEQVGRDSVDGSTRTKAVQQREGTSTTKIADRSRCTRTCLMTNALAHGSWPSQAETTACLHLYSRRRSQPTFVYLLLPSDKVAGLASQWAAGEK